MRLSGKTAVVTGGVGALGGAVVKALLEAGARVSVPFRKPGELGSLPAVGRASIPTRRFRARRST